MFQLGNSLKWGVLPIFWIFGCIGCAADDVEEGVVSAELDAAEEAGAATTEGSDAESAPSGDGAADPEEGANPDRVPIAGEGKERGRILGTLEVPGYQKGTIQLDAVVELESGAKVIANERYRKPGPFRLVIRGEYTEVNLVAYLDLDDDGPTAGDLRYEYEGNPISLADGERIEGLVVTVVEQTEQVDEEDEKQMELPDVGGGRWTSKTLPDSTRQPICYHELPTQF